MTDSIDTHTIQRSVGSEPAASAPNEEVAAGENRELDAMLSDIEALDSVSENWPEEYKLATTARIRAGDSLNAEAFRRLIKALKANPAASGALREAVSDELIYAVLRRHNILKPSLYERVESALDTIRPMLASHGGDVELVTVEAPAVEVRFLGACDGCPASAMTFYSGVKQAIADNVAEITEIKQVKGIARATSDTQVIQFTSPFAKFKSGDWVLATTLADLEEGATMFIVVDERSVILSRFDDKVTCFENACAHMGMTMDGGDIGEGFLTCPYHGFKYSLDSGECLTAPEVQLQPHGVRVVGDRVEVQLTK